MWVNRKDMVILRSQEHRELLAQYRQKFDEQFICFNYADFPGEEGKCAAQVYIETLREAVKADKPYHIVSHRYDVFDH